MKVINLTPHDVNICDDEGRFIKIYRANGKVARVNNGYEAIDYVNDIPLLTRADLTVIDLPEPREDTMYIVSNIILGYCPDRMDLIAPALQVKVNGRVVGCRAFVSNKRKS